jgi:alpha-mannosidase
MVLGSGIGDAVREGYSINLPERRLPGDAEVAPLVAVDDEAVVLSAVKLADDGSGDVVVRFYESHGGRVRTRLHTAFEAARIHSCDLLERPLAPVESADGTIELTLRPFELVTLRLSRPAA